MKKILVLIAMYLPAFIPATAQNVGIGTNNPVEKLEVNGGIKIGASSNTNPGTIRWNAVKNDFEGYNGAAWVSLTGNKGKWGNQQSYVTENDANQESLQTYNGYAGSFLGGSIAMENNILIAGARGDYGLYGAEKPITGNAYLYTKGMYGWERKGLIANPTPYALENFGTAVAIKNNHILIGASDAMVNGARKGEAYIFYNDTLNNSRTLLATLTAYDGQEQDYFGASVAISNDFAVVGAPLKDVGSGLENAGLVYVFKRNGTSWNYVHFISPSDRAFDNRFGYAVALYGNWLAVSAYRAVVNGVDRAGKVYLYKLNSNATQFVYHSTLTAPAPASYEEFGTSIHLCGDSLLVGAPMDVITPPKGNGTAMLYIRNGDTWSLQATFTASDGFIGDGFGSSVQLKDNVLVIGASKARVGSNKYQGKAYIFSYHAGNWLQQAILTSSDGAYGNKFGAQVATNGTDVVVAAPDASFRTFAHHGRLYFFNQ